MQYLVNFVPFETPASSLMVRGWFVRRNGTPLGELLEGVDGSVIFRPAGRTLALEELSGITAFIEREKKCSST